MIRFPGSSINMAGGRRGWRYVGTAGGRRQLGWNEEQRFKDVRGCRVPRSGVEREMGRVRECCCGGRGAGEERERSNADAALPPSNSALLSLSRLHSQQQQIWELFSVFPS